VRLGEIPRFEIDLIFTAAICSRPALTRYGSTP
jgi:hypothetical protein